MQKLVSNASLRNIHVTGELCNASFPHSGHVYFDLADGTNKKKKLSCTYFGARNKCNAHGLSFAKVLSEDDQTKMRYKLLGFKKGVDDGIYTPSPDANCKGGGV